MQTKVASVQSLNQGCRQQLKSGGAGPNNYGYIYLRQITLSDVIIHLKFSLPRPPSPHFSFIIGKGRPGDEAKFRPPSSPPLSTISLSQEASEEQVKSQRPQAIHSIKIGGGTKQLLLISFTICQHV